MQAIAQIPQLRKRWGGLTSVLLPERFGGIRVAPSAADLFRILPETRRSPETHPFSVPVHSVPGNQFLKTSFVFVLRLFYALYAL